MEEPRLERRSERFTRSLRLRRTEDYRRVQSTGRQRRTRHLVLVWLPSERELPRFGMAVSRRVGNAVTRNRVKRWLRESIRRNRHGVRGVDAVFIARSGAGVAGYQVIEGEVASLLAPLRTGEGV